MIAIIDYGAGNIFSLKNALDYLNIPNILTDKKEELISADGLVLPGVGAFPSAMNMLKESDLLDTVKEQAYKKPFLGICLGMQMLFTKSFEFGECEGLGFIEGTVELMEEKNLSIPHIGWNKLEIQNNCPILNGLSDNEYVYFVHSYKAHCEDKYVSAYCEYGSKVTAVVNSGNIYGTQFHPEKSGTVGLKILKNFGGLL